MRLKWTGIVCFFLRIGLKKDERRPLGEDNEWENRKGKRGDEIMNSDEDNRTICSRLRFSVFTCFNER